MVVPRTVTPLTDEDVAASLVLLQELYERDVMTTPERLAVQMATCSGAIVVN